MIEKIIEHLKTSAKPFKEIITFSSEPGIYALFFHGKSFPLKNYKSSAEEIIYIGKTLSSQQSRDADTHFATGKTGSSTVRKTIGCLLNEQLKMISIPRSQIDIEKKRYAHFRFDLKSEEMLTEWMKVNLSLSFYAYPKSAKEIDDLETLLISRLVPILNIDRKNIGNQYFSHIRVLRKQMAETAYSISKSIKTFSVEQVKQTPNVLKSNISFTSTNIHKYEDIWNNIMPTILQAIQSGKALQIEFSKGIFDKAGNRKSYSFNLEFINGKVSNNISGSAVARDLARVLENNNQFKMLSIGKHLKFKMGKDFIIEMK